MAAKRWSWVIAAVALVAAGSTAVWNLQTLEPRATPEPTPTPTRSTAQPEPRCIAPHGLLRRIALGYYPGRSGDVLMIERLPHQFGTRHSSVHPYTQEVPLVLYGPGFIRSGVKPRRPVTVAGLAPTYSRLMHFGSFPRRDGKVLRESLRDSRRRKPRLIVTVVWDGGGDNVLEQWPKAWPHLKRLMRAGTMYKRATVGSAPSITPAVHATIGTGAFPSKHGIPDTRMRIRGRVVYAWQGGFPGHLELRTIGDLWDRAKRNRPLVGMVARDAWHLGMLGHGDSLPRADRDIAVLDEIRGVDFRSVDHYALPHYVLGQRGLEAAIEEVDVRDGSSDDRWLGNPLLAFDRRIRFTPAWSIYQTKILLRVLRREGFGSDRLTDLLYTNYKATDLAGHAWNMTSREERDNLAEQDRQLGRLIRTLNRRVGKRNYVLALTADHGQAPYPRLTDGWSIELGELSRDIARRFDKTPTGSLVAANRMSHLILNRRELKRSDVTAKDIAAFVRDYRLGDNVTETNTVLPRFEDRTDERLFMAAMTPDGLRKALRCGRPS